MPYGPMHTFDRAYLDAALHQFGQTREWLDWTNTHGPQLSDLSPTTRFEMLRDAGAFRHATGFLIAGKYVAAGEAYWYTRNDVDGPTFADGDVWDPSTTTLLIAAQSNGPFRLVVDEASQRIIRAGE